MKARPNRSRSLTVLLSEFRAQPEAWRHGYDLSSATGLFSGTLYPLLIRLERDGYLEARWEESTIPGRPRRHAYRLTSEGVELAKELGANAPAPRRAVRLVGQQT